MEENKIALMIIYNHRYDKNIAKLNTIYKKDFSNIFHIVPFYDGQDPNVIAVYESSYYFSGYVAQAYERVKNMGFTHFVFIADDMILNPILNEHTILSKIGMSKNDCFVPSLLELGNIRTIWSRVVEGLAYNPFEKKTGAEIASYLPPYSDAKELFLSHNLQHSFKVGRSTCLKYILKKETYRAISFLSVRSAVSFARKLVTSVFKGHAPLNYPIVGGYSDFFIVNAEAMPNFSKYCGAFAATNLFVEIAVPTAMVLSSKNVITEESSLLKGRAYWAEEIPKFEQEFGQSILRLYEHFPKEYIYVHPIKLSRWKLD